MRQNFKVKCPLAGDTERKRKKGREGRGKLLLLFCGAGEEGGRKRGLLETDQGWNKRKKRERKEGGWVDPTLLKLKIEGS